MSGESVVVKLEPVGGKIHTLDHEFHVYLKLGRGIGIPRTLWFGAESGFDVMVTERLGASLDELFVQCHHRFSLKTVLLVANQMVSKFSFSNPKLVNFSCIQLRRLQYIHSCNYVHRDLKPSNIVMGVGKNANLVYIIDFGLSKRFRDPKTCLHIPYKDGRGLTGSVNFASINSHRGFELGRRDDLESLAYILIYFLCGYLPWQGRGKTTLEIKQAFTSHSMFCRLPVEIRGFLEHARSLGFSEKPNYDLYCNLFNNILLHERFPDTQMFDWEVAPGQNPHL